MSEIDINRILQNIGELQNQNAIDFQQWKRLGQEIERLEGKIKTSDSHLNLLMKKIKADYESLRKVIVDENIQVQLNNKIEKNKSEINKKVNKETFDVTTKNINNSIKSINEQLIGKASKNELELERKRIDSLTQLKEGSTTGDAELIDGRIGADGFTYSSLGQSIRTQVGRLNDEIFTTIEFNKLDLTFINGYYTLSGTISNGESKFRAEINVNPGEIYKVKGASFWEMPMYVVLNSNGDVVSKYPTSSTSEAYDKEILISETGKLVINYSTKRSGTGEEYKPVCYKKLFKSKINEIEKQISDNKNLINNNTDKLNNIKKLLTTNVYNEINLEFENGATNISGNTLDGGNYFHCDIEINTLLNYKVKGYNYWQMPLYVILDSDGNKLANYPTSSQESSLIEREITSFPTGATTLRINYTTNYAGQGEEYKPKCYKNNTTINNEDSPLYNLGKTSVMTPIINKYGIIGDSLSSGAQDTENGGNAVDMPKYSWATFLEKATGCETVRLSKGGLQLKNWHTIMEAKARLEENKCPAYIIMLGHNDTASGAGTISDVDLTNLSNSSEETQFGMYGRLIGTLRDISPDCRIFCVTYPIYYVENYGTNNIARTLPNYIDNCYCIDLWKYDKNRKTVANTSFATPNPYFSKLHGTVLGYKNWSDIINSTIDYIIRNNLAEFADVAYINTDYTFN